MRQFKSITTRVTQPMSENTPISDREGTKIQSYTPLECSIESGEHHVYVSKTKDDDLHVNQSPPRSKIIERSAILLVSFGALFILTVLFSRFSLHSNNDLEGGILSPKLPFESVAHPEPPTPLWGAVQKPYPTGAFWTNFAVRDGEATVVVYPYGLQCKPTGVHVSYGATRRRVTKTSIIDEFADDLIIASVEPYSSRSISNGGKVAVTMEYKTTTPTNGKYMLHAVKSTPFVTIEYEKTTPVISSPSMQFLHVESRLIAGTAGVQYLVTLGNFQKWLVYCSEQVLFTLIGQGSDSVLTAAQPITGVVRVAILPVQRFEQSINALQPYLSRYPTDVKATISYPSDTKAEVEFKYICKGDGKLLTLALPHHQSLLDKSLTTSKEAAVVQENYFPIFSIKGKMQPIIGEEWKLKYELADIDWYYHPDDDIPTDRMDTIAQTLLYEVSKVNPEANDPYGFGKEVGRMAQLALVADFMGMAEARKTAIANVEKALLPWLEGTNADPLMYESSYGGVCSTNSLQDFMADYGSGWYNDHEFHYGYFLFAAGVVAKIDNAGTAGFLTSGSTIFSDSKRKLFFDALLRDVCNPTADEDFPQVRHKDFFDGHSWASGLFPEANGKGQESSSEAVNAYYGSYLYATATKNTAAAKFAHLMLTMEIQAARIYWHIENDLIYDNLFASNRMVGNIGALDVTATTWFGDEAEYVHGIQLMPLTPATGLLFDSTFVSMEYPVLQQRLDSTRPPPTKKPSGPKECSAYEKCAALGLTGNCCPNDSGDNLVCCQYDDTDDNTDDELDPFIIDEWRNLIYNILAVADRDTAWKELLKIDNFGSGNSKSNSLLWTATRSAPLPNFNASYTASPTTSYVKTECITNSACDAIGMLGECCPTDEGQYLGCCPQIKAS